LAHRTHLKAEQKMKQFCHELTLTNMLTDPMVRTVMAADRVDPQELATMLAGIAETLKPPPRWHPPAAQFVCAN
jgi:hypothetical protein